MVRARAGSGDAMANEKVTSLQVAELAGVSQSAVSRVFTPGSSVSRKTAEKVRLAAEKLGYRPNILARSLKSGKSRIIGLVAAYLENHFYPRAVELISAELQKMGYHVLVFLGPATLVDTDRVVRELMDYQVDGIILASVTMSSELAERCLSIGVPVVLFNRAQDGGHLSSVTTDNFAGGRALADFLCSLGHDRIAYIAGLEGAMTQRDREAGFRAGLAAAGKDLFARAIGNFRHEEAQSATRELFATSKRPDAVFVANDHMAFAAMDVLRFELGLRVPEDVSVVGFDDVPPAAWPSYSLTTYRQHVERMVAETVAILTEPGEDRVPRQVVLDGSLVIRGSTRRHGAGR
jgi:DNA-binding LacI/PurR family transcriptional regulator